MIPNCCVNNDKLLASIQHYIKKKDFDRFVYVGSPVCTSEKEIMPRTYFGQPTLYPFEGISVYGPEKPDAYLTCLYGNYRELPPAEKRKSHHDFLHIDLTKPYTAPRP